jgi:hypothetical protein
MSVETLKISSKCLFLKIYFYNNVHFIMNLNSKYKENSKIIGGKYRVLLKYF